MLCWVWLFLLLSGYGFGCSCLLLLGFRVLGFCLGMMQSNRLRCFFLESLISSGNFLLLLVMVGKGNLYVNVLEVTFVEVTKIRQQQKNATLKCI